MPRRTARPLLGRSLQLREAALAAAAGVDEAAGGHCFISKRLGRASMRFWRFAAAMEQQHSKALTRQHEALGKDHKDVGTTYNNMAALVRLGNCTEALALLQKHLAIVEKAVGEAFSVLAVTLNNIAQMNCTRALRRGCGSQCSHAADSGGDLRREAPRRGLVLEQSRHGAGAPTPPPAPLSCTNVL